MSCIDVSVQLLSDANKHGRMDGSRQNIAVRFGMDKLEWWGYPTMKKF